MGNLSETKTNGKAPGISAFFRKEAKSQELPFKLIASAAEIGHDASGVRDVARFRKQLGWLIKEAPPAVRLSVTPEMAKVMMERNSSDEWHNRPASEKGVARFARAMASGRWAYTAETIIFSRTGNLLNGQHRLQALILSGATIEVLVAFGVEDEAFRMMDTGVSRTAGHIFAIENVPNYNFTASVCRIVRSYLDSQTWTGSNSSGVNAPDNDELLDFYYQHPNIPNSYAVARKLSDAGLLSPRWGGAIHYICALKNRKEADAFFEKVASDLGHTDPKAPEYLLRKRMLDSARSAGDNKEADLYLAAYAIQAWNTKRKGDKRSIFRWRGQQNPNESFPRAV